MKVVIEWGVGVYGKKGDIKMNDAFDFSEARDEGLKYKIPLKGHKKLLWE